MGPALDLPGRDKEQAPGKEKWTKSGPPSAGTSGYAALGLGAQAVQVQDGLINDRNTNKCRCSLSTYYVLSTFYVTPH